MKLSQLLYHCNHAFHCIGLPYCSIIKGTTLFLLILILNYCKSVIYIFFILNLLKINDMKNLNLSNSCVNCDNLVFTAMTCGVHKVEVSEKYTCSEFQETTTEA